MPPDVRKTVTGDAKTLPQLACVSRRCDRRARFAQSKSKKGSNMSQSADRSKVLQNTLTTIEREYGKGSIMRLGDKDAKIRVSVISTGSISLDHATGIGGVPRGRIVEIYGPEASGKTTLTLHVVAEAQKNGGIAAFIDAEHALDPVYARNLGVDTDNLLVSQPDYGEQALEIAERLIRSNALDVVVVDSVAALVPKSEIEGEMGDHHVGTQARLMSQAMRKLTSVVAKSRTTLIFINQIRMKIGVMFGNPETTTGGNALKFYSSLRMEIRRIENIKSGDKLIGSRTRVKVVKNKMAPPFRQTEFDIIYGQGISHAGDLLDLAVQNDIIQKSGTWFSYQEEQLGQGRDNVRRFLIEHPDILTEIEKKVRVELGLEDAEPEAAPPEAAKPAKASTAKAGNAGK